MPTHLFPRPFMKTFRLLPLFVAIGATLALPVQAQSLVDLYQSARDYDATYQSAKSQFDATLARADQALMPPAILATYLKPRAFRKTATCMLRVP